MFFKSLKCNTKITSEYVDNELYLKLKFSFLLMASKWVNGFTSIFNGNKKCKNIKFTDNDVLYLEITVWYSHAVNHALSLHIDTRNELSDHITALYASSVLLTSQMAYCNAHANVILC